MRDPQAAALVADPVVQRAPTGRPVTLPRPVADWLDAPYAGG
jgi:hypothetical protein